MNQKQRAGKHPSFSKDRKPPGMRRESFIKKINDPKLHKKPRETRQERKTLTLKSASFVETKQDQLPWSLRKHTDDNKQEGIKCQSVKRPGNVRLEKTVSIAKLIDGATKRSWRSKFDDKGQYKEDRACFLRSLRERNTAATVSPEDSAKLDPAVLPKVRNRKHALDVLYAESWSLNAECFLRYVKTAYRKEDRPVEQCLRESLQHRHWALLRRLFSQFSPSTPDVDAVLKSAVLHKQWELILQSVQSGNASRQILHLTLAKALALKHWATIEACVKRGADIASACADQGFDLNCKTGESRTTLLQAAASLGSEEKAELLLRAGADPDLNDERRTVFHQAVRDHRWDLVRILLKYSTKAGKIVSQLMACDGTTLLHVLCEQGQADLVHTLLLMKADPLIMDSEGNTLMMTAMDAMQGRENLIRILIQAGAASHQASESRARLLSLRKKLNGPIQHFRSPMWQAVSGGHLRLAKILYASGSCSREEIHELSTYLANRDAPHPDNNVRASPTARDNCYAFVEEISSRPRSLRDACALRISHLIGCGPEREERAGAVGLPEPLRRLVLMDDVVSPDFLNDCAPDPQRSSAFHYENLLGPLEPLFSYFSVY